MTQQQPNESLTESVTDSGVEALAHGASDAEIRDVTCTRCGRSVGDSTENPVCFPAGIWRGEQLHGAYCLPCVQEYLGTWHLGGPGGYRVTCGACGRHMLGPRYRTACSDPCRRQALRDRRRQMREAVTPESFTCSSCEKEIADTVVFWWNGEWGRDRAHDVIWCESCWATMRVEEDREGYADYLKNKDEPGLIGHLTRRLGQAEDPDSEGYDPFAQVHGFETKPCGHCGRSIRWGNPEGFCCEHCSYEGRKAARRVEPTERKCKVCGKNFTPKRSDARTCSDRCRQELSRKKKRASKAKKRVTTKTPKARCKRCNHRATHTVRSAPGDRGFHVMKSEVGADLCKRHAVVAARNLSINAEVDGKPRAKRRTTPRKPKGRTRGTSSKGGRRAPVAQKSDTTPRCAWIGGCEAPATHIVASGDTETGWAAAVSSYVSPTYCEQHAVKEAKTKHCEKCSRRATHTVGLDLGGTGVYAEKSKRWAGYCKRHAEAEARNLQEPQRGVTANGVGPGARAPRYAAKRDNKGEAR